MASTDIPPTLSAAGHTVMDLRTVDPSTPGFMDGVSWVLRDHENVRGLFKQYRDLPATDENTEQSVLQQKMKLVRQIVYMVSTHASAEERYMYPLLLTNFPDRDPSEMKTLYDRNIADDTINKYIMQFLLDHSDLLLAPGIPMTPAEGEGRRNMWKLLDATVLKFITVEEEHIKEEEDYVLPLLKSGLSAEDNDKLWRNMAWGIQSAPTHPHPEGATGGIGGTAALFTHPVVAALDKVVDWMQSHTLFGAPLGGKKGEGEGEKGEKGEGEKGEGEVEGEKILVGGGGGEEEMKEMGGEMGEKKGMEGGEVKGKVEPGVGETRIEQAEAA